MCCSVLASRSSPASARACTSLAGCEPGPALHWAEPACQFGILCPLCWCCTALAASLYPQGVFGWLLWAQGWHNTVVGGFLEDFTMISPVQLKTLQTSSGPWSPAARAGGFVQEAAEGEPLESEQGRFTGAQL